MKKKILIFLVLVILVVTMLLVSCQPKTCPAYSSTNVSVMHV